MQSATAPYRTGNTLFADAGELRAVAGMSPALYRRLRPWLCALPTSDLSPINLNTLSPEQAPLLAMLAPGQLGVERARGGTGVAALERLGQPDRILADRRAAAASTCRSTSSSSRS